MQDRTINQIIIEVVTNYTNKVSDDVQEEWTKKEKKKKGKEKNERHRES